MLNSGVSKLMLTTCAIVAVACLLPAPASARHIGSSHNGGSHGGGSSHVKSSHSTSSFHSSGHSIFGKLAHPFGGSSHSERNQSSFYKGPTHVDSARTQNFSSRSQQPSLAQPARPYNSYSSPSPSYYARETYRTPTYSSSYGRTAPSENPYRPYRAEPAQQSTSDNYNYRSLPATERYSERHSNDPTDGRWHTFEKPGRTVTAQPYQGGETRGRNYSQGQSYENSRGASAYYNQSRGYPESVRASQYNYQGGSSSFASNRSGLPFYGSSASFGSILGSTASFLPNLLLGGLLHLGPIFGGGNTLGLNVLTFAAQSIVSLFESGVFNQGDSAGPGPDQQWSQQQWPQQQGPDQQSNQQSNNQWGNQQQDYEQQYGSKAPPSAAPATPYCDSGRGVWRTDPYGTPYCDVGVPTQTYGNAPTYPAPNYPAYPPTYRTPPY